MESECTVVHNPTPNPYTLPSNPNPKHLGKEKKYNKYNPDHNQP